MYRLTVSGVVENGLAPYIARRLREAGAAGAAAVYLDIDTPGTAGQLTDLPHGQRPRGVTWLPNGKGLIIGVLERTSDIVLFDQGS